MVIRSINEPEAAGHNAHTPASHNEPPALPELERPAIIAIAPDQALLGDPDFRVHLSGEGFYAVSVIVFAGNDEPTLMNEDGTLSANVDMASWLVSGVVKVAVRNGELVSNEVDFTFIDPADVKDDDDDVVTEAVEDPSDPDQLEDEIELAAEEGDFQPMHAPPPKKKRGKRR